MVNVGIEFKLKDLPNKRKVAVNSLGVFNKSQDGMRYLHIDLEIDSYEKRAQSDGLFSTVNRPWEHSVSVSGELSEERSSEGLDDNAIEAILNDSSTTAVLYSNIAPGDVFECGVTLTSELTEVKLSGELEYDSYGGMSGELEETPEDDPIESLLYGKKD